MDAQLIQATERLMAAEGGEPNKDDAAMERAWANAREAVAKARSHPHRSLNDADLADALQELMGALGGEPAEDRESRAAWNEARRVLARTRTLQRLHKTDAELSPAAGLMLAGLMVAGIAVVARVAVYRGWLR